jgi:hypothetical protein
MATNVDLWQRVSHTEMLVRGYEFLYQSSLCDYYCKDEEFVEVCCGLVTRIYKED